MSLHYSRPDDASGHTLPDLEIFHSDDYPDLLLDIDGVPTPPEPGWYWWSCLPGCLPDGDADGPYESEAAALEAARECVD